MNRHTHTQPQKRAARDKRGPRAPHTHCRHTTSATRRPAREERTAHTQFKFECDRAPSECAGPGSRRGRRHGLQHDGDGAASRRRYGGGRVYMELTIDGLASRPAGGLVWPDGVKASSMESPDGGTRPSGATEMALLDRPHDRRAVSFGPTARRHHQWRARTAARGRPAQLNNIDGVVRRPAGGLVWPNGVPTWRRQHQCKSLDCPISFPRGAVTGCENVLSPMSRRREVRSLRADRPRGESGGDGQAAA